MIEDAEHRELLDPGKEIVEPTSGNTGISLVFVVGIGTGRTITGVSRYIKKLSGKLLVQSRLSHQQVQYCSKSVQISYLFQDRIEFQVLVQVLFPIIWVSP